LQFGSNSDWYFKFLGGLQMDGDSRGWQQLELHPQVYNDQRGVSICANLSSTSASIITPRGPLIGEWHCVNGAASTCAVVDEKDTAEVSCPAGGTISSVDFASFGTPEGSCLTGLVVNSSCNAADSKTVVEKLCLGKASCSISASDTVFSDPCFNVSCHSTMRSENPA
jgi:hypothetical protein